MDEITARVGTLERQLRILRFLAVAGLGLSTLLAGFTFVSRFRPLSPTKIVISSPNGARTLIEGGTIKLESAEGQRITLQVDAHMSTAALATHDRNAVAPELVLRVGDTGTPASVLLSDRKARNFSNLYINNGTAGLEQAGVREYRNTASP